MIQMKKSQWLHSLMIMKHSLKAVLFKLMVPL